MTHQLNERQRMFVEYSMLIHTYPTITDAYIAVYRPNGTRRTSMASASRLNNLPAVKAYRAELREKSARRVLEMQEKERRNFLDSQLIR